MAISCSSAVLAKIQTDPLLSPYLCLNSISGYTKGSAAGHRVRFLSVVEASRARTTLRRTKKTVFASRRDPRSQSGNDLFKDFGAKQWHRYATFAAKARSLAITSLT